MTMTLEELERRAYADGDMALTALLQYVEDEFEDRVDAVASDRAERAYDEGYDAGVKSCQ
jgi:hypothetical protein